MKNVKRYIQLMNREVKQDENAKKYEIGLNYNPIKRDLWLAKSAKTNQELEALEEVMTEEEKEKVEEILGVEIF